MEDRKTMAIISITTILAIGMTLYGENKSIEKVDNKDIKYSSEIYINTNTSSVQSE